MTESIKKDLLGIIDFIQTMEDSYVGQMRDRFLLGKWAAYEGLVYPNFKEEVHMLSREFMLTYLESAKKRMDIKSIEGYDFGMASPSCYLFGFVDEYGRVFILDGFHKAEMSFEEQDSKIRAIRAKYLGLVEIESPILADPDMFKRKVMPGYKSLGTTIAEKFESEFGIKMRPADNSIDAGISKVSSYLNQYSNLPRIHPSEKSSLIYFASDLEFIQEEFGSYFWKKNPQNEAEDKPIDRNDHAMDAIKYMLSFRPKPGQIVQVQQNKVPAWMFWHEVDDKHVERRIF
jgi:hypothetical protein